MSKRSLNGIFIDEIVNGKLKEFDREWYWFRKKL